MKHPRCRSVAVFPAEAADTPFDPHKGNSEQEEGNEVRNHKCAAAVIGALDGEAQEITEADRVSGHRENESKFRAPLFARVVLVFCRMFRMLSHRIIIS